MPRLLAPAALACIALIACGREGSAPPAPLSGARDAVERAVPLLQASARHWTAEVGCFSCHHQGFGPLALALASESGIPVDEAAWDAEADAVRRYSLERYEALLVCDGIGVFGRGTTLLALAARGRPQDDVTDVVAHFLAARQTASGAWYSNEHRPPFEDSHATATALTVRALRLYAPPGRAAETAARVERARRWLARLEPRDHEERCMRMLGLAWCGEPAARLADAAAEVLARQNPDGGWAQIPTRPSDPYATGQALVVLNQAAGLPTDDPAWVRGARFLVGTQRDDGSWFVRTRRRIKGLPMVDSGFPYGRSQFISYFASTWACMALSLGARGARERSPVLFGPAPPRDDTDRTAEESGLTGLHRASAFGSLEEVRRSIEAGAPVDERGPRGVTALMLAVRDGAIFELLLESGADPSASSEWGFTPLLLAALTSGTGGVVERLIALGAPVDCEGVNGAHPLIAVASLGDVETLRLLVDAGVPIAPEHLQNALIYAATCDDVDVGRALLAIGADIDGASERHWTPLVAASIAGNSRFVEFALEAGADTEVKDGEGMTALAWAAKVDPGHARVVEQLLEAGARLDSRSANGRTPLEWAHVYRNDHHTRALLGTEGGE